MGSWRVRITAVLVALIGLGGLLAAPAQASTTGESHHRGHHPRASYYLSLGDSLAFGYQPDLVAAGDFNPAHYRSYAEHYAAVNRRVHLVNYGCPGETTTTLIKGGCPWLPRPLHNSYGKAKSQLQAAATFLKHHRGQVSLVTIDIGSNDLLAVVDPCLAKYPTDPAGLQTCLTSGLPAALGTIATNYAKILKTVKRYAPHAKVVMFDLYNPLALEVPGSDALVAVVNQTLAGIAAGAHAKLADAFRAINIKAGSTAEQFGVCTFTWMCTSYHNIHPTTRGYWRLTGALVAALR